MSGEGQGQGQAWRAHMPSRRRRTAHPLLYFLWPASWHDYPPLHPGKDRFGNVVENPRRVSGAPGWQGRHGGTRQHAAAAGLRADLWAGRGSLDPLPQPSHRLPPLVRAAPPEQAYEKHSQEHGDDLALLRVDDEFVSLADQVLRSKPRVSRACLPCRARFPFQNLRLSIRGRPVVAGAPPRRPGFLEPAP